MPSNFPGAIDSFTDPLSNSPLNSPSHSTLHSDINDAVEKVETYMGLVKVIPTSGTNCTISATGTVTATAGSASFTVNGAFSSLYDNYRIVISNLESTTPGNGYYFTLGASATGANYYVGGYYINISTAAQVAYRVNNGSNLLIGTANTGTKYSTAFDVVAPNLAQRTYFPTVSLYAETGFVGSGSGLQDATTQHTAFTIAGSATISSATVRVYGYRN